MIVARLKGGLGNQLFQYACGRAMSLRHQVPLKLDLSGLENDPLGRVYELHHYRIVAELASKKDCRALCGPPRKTLRRITRRFFEIPYPSSYYAQSRSADFDADVLHRSPPLYLDGYWQSERYFEQFAETIRDELQLACDISEDTQHWAARMQESSNPVSVHFRRGDYASDPNTLKHHGLCSLEYYDRAVSSMQQTFTDMTLFVFSDDPAWVKAHFRTDSPCHVIEQSHPGHEDIWLMSQASHHIIANSSFSWWGAWLNASPEKRVVAPIPWFRKKGKLGDAIIPTAWTRMDI